MRQNLATATTDLRRRLANKERAAEVQRLIDEAKESEKKIAERIAELERLEFAAAAYTKANIEAVEAAINSRFNLVRWRMYEQTIEGADVETCVATIDGVPFNSLNSARGRYSPDLTSSARSAATTAQPRRLHRQRRKYFADRFCARFAGHSSASGRGCCTRT